MAKVAFSKLGLKKVDQVKHIIINENDIEIKQYLPVNDKLDLIVRVINSAQDENNFPNPVKIDVLTTLEIIFTYTNISFTDKQKEDVGKLYDLLDSNGVINSIIAEIPEEEYSFIINSLDKTIDGLYAYKNSVLGILETVSQDYSNLDLNATELQKKLSDPNSLALLKDVLTKLG